MAVENKLSGPEEIIISTCIGDYSKRRYSNGAVDLSFFDLKEGLTRDQMTSGLTDLVSSFFKDGLY